MANNEDLEKLEGVLKGFADLIREGEGTDQPVAVSSMREKIAAIDMAKFTVDDSGLLTGFTVKSGSEDPSEPVTDLEYFEKLMANFADKVRVGSEKLGVDGIKAQEDLSCGIHKDTRGQYTLRLPDSVTDLNVRSFNSQQKPYIKGIENLPSTLTELKTGVFSGCYALDPGSLKLPSTITSIGDQCFYTCGQDNKGIIHETPEFIVPSAVTSIGDHAFYDANIESITLPAGLTVLDTGVLWNTKIKDLTIPSGVTDIKKNALAISTLETLVLPTSLASFSKTAFGDRWSKSSYNLRSITMPGENSTYKVHNNCVITYNSSYGKPEVMFGCSGSVLTDPADAIGVIASSAFYKTSIASVQIPASVEYVGGQAFYECNKLKTVSFLGGVVDIDGSAFYECPLESLTINSEVSHIGSMAFFDYDSKIKSLDFSAPSDGYCELEMNALPPYLEQLNSNEKGTFNMERMNLRRFCFDRDVPNSDEVVSLELTDVKLAPYSSESYGLFSACDNLTSLTITDSYASVADGAPRYPVTVEGLCAIATINGYKTVICGCANSTIPQDTEAVADRAFAYADFEQHYDAIYLTSCHSVGSNAFCGSHLSKVIFGNSLEKIESGAFDDCWFTEYDESNPGIELRYGGNSLEDIAEDDTFKSDILESLYNSHSSAYAKITAYSGESAVKRLSEWYGRGSGSGSGY